MAGGTFNLSSGKVRPGTYVNLKNGRPPAAQGSNRGTACILLIGYDYGPRNQWIKLSASAPDAAKARLGRSIYDDNEHMLLLQLLFMNATTVYVYIPDGGEVAKASAEIGDTTAEISARYKGSLGNKLQLSSIKNPVAGYDVAVYLGGVEIEVFEGISKIEEIEERSEYVTTPAKGELAAFASVSLAGGADTVSGNSGISTFLDMSEKIKFNAMCFPTEESSLQTALLTKIKYIRNSIGWKCQAVAPNFSADCEGIINVTNSFEYSGKRLTAAQACAWVAGATAAADYITSNTYVTVPGATAVVDEKTHEEAELSIKAGELFFSVSDSGEVQVETDINSRVKIDLDTPQNINKNRPLRVYDTFCNDCLLMFKPNQFSGKESDYIVIEGLGKEMLKRYEKDGAITNVDIDNDFVVDRGLSEGDYVVINVGLQAVDSIEKFYITVIAR